MPLVTDLVSERPEHMTTSALPNTPEDPGHATHALNDQTCVVNLPAAVRRRGGTMTPE